MDLSQTGGRYLGNEVSVNKAVAVSTASVEVSQPKIRAAISIRNVSTAGQVISLALSNNDVAVVNSGVQLGVGESFIDSSGEGYRCWSGSIRAISSAIGGSIAIMERVAN